MNVKNEQENLPRCLASIQGIFDEIVIVDTGIADRTKEIVRSLGRGCLISSGSIVSRGAERALSHATGDYAFWLDADDVVEPAERVKLVALLAGLLTPPTDRPEVSSPGARPSAPRPWLRRVCRPLRV